jgi:hypothetical protein
MGEERPPGPMCTTRLGPDWIDGGTLCLDRSNPPVPTGVEVNSPVSTMTIYSESVRSAANATASEIGQLTYDSFIRKYVYQPAAQAISQQGEEFVRKGLLTRKTAAEWVVAQRNGLLTSIRDEKNTPLGRAISEYLKPRDNLPTTDGLLAKYAAKNPKATTEELYEAIILSGARTSGSVNKVSLRLRCGGLALIVVNVGVSAYLVAQAPPGQKGRLAARELGGLTGGIAGGWAGAELGCEAGALVGVWFEGIGAVPGCAIGAIVGGFGLGWAASEAGSALGEWTFHTGSTFVQWSASK